MVQAITIFLSLVLLSWIVIILGIAKLIWNKYVRNLIWPRPP